MLPHVIKEELDKIVEADTTQNMQKGAAYELLLTGQEVIVTQGKVAIALRPDIGLWMYITVDPSNMKVQKVEASEYLELKENLSGQCKLLQTVSLANQPHDCPSKPPRLGQTVQAKVLNKKHVRRCKPQCCS